MMPNWSHTIMKKYWFIVDSAVRVKYWQRALIEPKRQGKVLHPG